MTLKSGVKRNVTSKKKHKKKDVNLTHCSISLAWPECRNAFWNNETDYGLVCCFSLVILALGHQSQYSPESGKIIHANLVSPTWSEMRFQTEFYRVMRWVAHILHAIKVVCENKLSLRVNRRSETDGHRSGVSSARRIGASAGVTARGWRSGEVPKKTGGRVVGKQTNKSHAGRRLFPERQIEPKNLQPIKGVRRHPGKKKKQALVHLWGGMAQKPFCNFSA